MPRKPLLIVGVSLIGLAVLAMLVLQFRPAPRPSLAPAKPYEPPFVKEGSLSFIDGESREVLRSIDIEIADTEQRITQGLMYRRSMADSLGMLFVFDRMEPRSFWMKNTYISLDIIYVDEFNRIVSIQRNTQPLSTRPLPSEGPAQYVIEVVAGFCENHRIEPGDFVRFDRVGA
ncbi:MAG: DUF192 domain-containing protein [Bacteroidia bacterium]